MWYGKRVGQENKNRNTEILASHREGSGRMIPKKSKDGKPKDMEAEIRGYP